MQRLSKSVISLFVVLEVLLCKSIPVVLNRIPISIANFSMLTFPLKLLSVNAIGYLRNMNSHPIASVCRVSSEAGHVQAPL